MSSAVSTVRHQRPPVGTTWAETAEQIGIIAPGSFFGAATVTTKGRERVVQILEAALRILPREGLVKLTLRNVAREADITLANLQHYFATHADLVNGMLILLADNYDRTYRQMFERPFASPVTKLEAVLRFFLDDCTRSETAALFFEIWSMCQRDERLSRTMDSMYGWHRWSIERMVLDAIPGLPDDEIVTRAALIVTQIEGLSVIYCHGRLDHPNPEAFRKACIEQLLKIALG